MLYKGENLCDYCFRPRGDSKFCPHCGLSEFTYTAEARQLPAGTNLNGHYIVGKVLGQGGFGVTYLAFSAAREGIVAIKEYLPASISYRGKGETNVSLVSANDKELFEKGAQRFYEEAKTISQFSNKNIISVYEFFYANNTVYYSMEYLEGVDLRNYIARKGGTLSESEIISVTLDVCNALRSLHDTNILHRDIAPDNIFRCDNGDTKLIDFGTAKQVVNNGEQNFSVVVKNGFAPIEQYKRDGNQGPWTDIYALGATMYYALTGEVAPNSFERLESPELSFGGRIDSYSPALVSIISKCMAVKSGDRYQDVSEIIRELTALKGVSPSPSPAPVAVQPAVQEAPVVEVKQPVAVEEPKPTTATEVKQPSEAPKPEVKKETPASPSKKKGKLTAIIAAILAVIAIAVVAIVVIPGNGNSATTDSIEATTDAIHEVEEFDVISDSTKESIINAEPVEEPKPADNIKSVEESNPADRAMPAKSVDSIKSVEESNPAESVEPDKSFGITDSNANYVDAVNTVVALGIISGYPDGTFRPKNGITRAEFAQIAYILKCGADAGSEAFANQTSCFDDVEGVSPIAWAKGYINYCYNQKIISGFGNKLYPGEKITVLEATKMLLVVLGYDPDAEGFNGPSGNGMIVGKAIEIDLLKDLAGYVETPITREVAAKLICNALEIDNGNRIRVKR